MTLYWQPAVVKDALSILRTMKQRYFGHCAEDLSTVDDCYTTSNLTPWGAAFCIPTPRAEQCRLPHPMTLYWQPAVVKDALSILRTMKQRYFGNLVLTGRPSIGSTSRTSTVASNRPRLAPGARSSLGPSPTPLRAVSLGTLWVTRNIRFWVSMIGGNAFAGHDIILCF
jgi:hypothetical protein